MFTFKRPDDDAVNRFIEVQKALPLSYSGEGLTREGEAPPGVHVHHRRVCVGRGEATFERACEAVRRWSMFEMPWVRLVSPQTPLEVGQVVAVVSGLGLWSVNACRIVYTLDDVTVEPETGAQVRRYGFGYGSLPKHLLRGEERFMVTWDQGDDSVTYDLYAFSWPGHWLTKIGLPLVRQVQWRFGTASLAAMRRAVEAPSVQPAGSVMSAATAE